MIEIFDDIRKLYTFRHPCPELADSIEFFSESSPEETSKHIAGEPFTVKMFPSWTPTFWFNLGSPYQLVTGNRACRIQPDTDVLILRDTITERRNLPTDHIFTVKFFPGGLDLLSGIPRAALTDQIIDLRTVLPATLIHAVKTAGSFEDRIDLLEYFFIRQLKTRKQKVYPVQFVRNAIESFGRSHLKSNNNQITGELFTTSKTLNRYFHTVVGTSPKQFFSAMRTRATLTAYVSGRKNFNPGDYGYYDLSHFYKDVIRFTGQKISAYPL